MTPQATATGCHDDASRTSTSRNPKSSSSKIAGEPLNELNGQQLFRGSGPWATCGHEQRAEARHRLLDWIGERKHVVVASGVVYDRFSQFTAECEGAAQLSPSSKHPKAPPPPG